MSWLMFSPMLLSPFPQHFPQLHRTLFLPGETSWSFGMCVLMAANPLNIGANFVLRVSDGWQLRSSGVVPLSFLFPSPRHVYLHYCQKKKNKSKKNPHFSVGLEPWPTQEGSFLVSQVYRIFPEAWFLRFGDTLKTLIFLFMVLLFAVWEYISLTLSFFPSFLSSFPPSLLPFPF